VSILNFNRNNSFDSALYDQPTEGQADEEEWHGDFGAVEAIFLLPGGLPTNKDNVELGGLEER
jgi:hypothetical protein